MNILKLELTHFGKFHLKTITFTSGLNIVYGKNEAGKSTIHAFVRSMLFGIPDTEEEMSVTLIIFHGRHRMIFAEECGLKKMIKYTESSETF